ncbi:MAG: hypothetical protein C0592_13805 [Marinilabiliales bacterium]|nr:MAG: hypothetical protein C0592_13805 [Marinilabiliales bacterium]
MPVEAVKSVLISPLCWGLGHATRIIPVIRAFQKENCNVFVFANRDLNIYLKQRFPDLQYFEDRSTCFRYKKGMGLSALIKSGIKVYKRYGREQRMVKRLLRKQHFDIIVSDNRYGIWNRKSRNVFITHQLRPKLSGITSLFRKRMHRYIENKLNNFEHVWIPDYKDALLSGDLSAFPNASDKFEYIGILSRFEKTESVQERIDHYYLIITSGPIEHRIEMSDYFIKYAKETDAKIKIIGESSFGDISDNAELIHQPDDARFKELVLGASCIITHSGYSTIMDLIQLGKSAIIIPTPGQTEQLYLAKRLQKYFVYAPTLQQAVHFIDIHIDELPPLTLKPESSLAEKVRQVVYH